ncbi:hypothetical protein [Rurimicrobium arvi]|uniref:DUF304 domain-containing protein n=1 Tax=Rurimicrobium arvi TaxID=2049916 RepID=A0ABP8MW08_9BACT
MSLPGRNDYYLEALTPSELAFLQKKAGKQVRTYRLLVRILLIGAVCISFAGGWKNVRSDKWPFNTVTVFSWENYFITLLILCVLFLFAVRFSRRTELSKIIKDMKQRVKVVERVMIEKKTFLPHNNTFHFYLNSATRLSIQVEEQDFMILNEGDEINIEYSRNAGVYFGYF